MHSQIGQRHQCQRQSQIGQRHQCQKQSQRQSQEARKVKSAGKKQQNIGLGKGTSAKGLNFCVFVYMAGCSHWQSQILPQCCLCCVDLPMSDPKQCACTHMYMQTYLLTLTYWITHGHTHLLTYSLTSSPFLLVCFLAYQLTHSLLYDSRT